MASTKRFSLREDSKSRKTVLLVKCTDSCLRAFDDAKKLFRASSALPSVHFGANGTGQLHLPSGCGEKRFDFSLSCLSGDITCLKEDVCNLSLLSCGRLSDKLTIKATEEVYQETKEKMSRVEEDNKKVSTKKLEEYSSPKIGKGKTSKPLKIKHLPPSHAFSPKSSLDAAVRIKTSPVPSPKNKPIPEGHTVIREWVIHFLALQPSRQTDLVKRIVRAGLTGPGIATISAHILPQVATSRGNKFYLNRSLYSTIKPYWEHYSPSERKIASANIEAHTKSNTANQQSKRPNIEESEKLVAKKPRPCLEDPLGLLSNTDQISNEEPTNDSSITESEVNNQWKKKKRTPSTSSCSSTSSTSSLASSDFDLKYPPLMDKAEALRYREDYYREYPEYCRLYEYIKAFKEREHHLRNEYRHLHDKDCSLNKINSFNRRVVELFEREYKKCRIKAKEQRLFELSSKLRHIQKCLRNFSTPED